MKASIIAAISDYAQY